MSCFRFDSMNRHGLSDRKSWFPKGAGWTGHVPQTWSGQTVPFGKERLSAFAEGVYVTPPCVYMS
ncbi:hypothetical protein [Faecalimonas sp.]